MSTISFPVTATLLVALAFVIGFLFGQRWRRHRYQNAGEALLSKVLRERFSAPDYHLMNHVTLRLSDGTTQVDHILVSRFGVFVIETKDYKGWIFANPRQSTWTQVIYRGKFRFQNPIFQNMRHVRAVQELLDFLPPGAIRSLVVFVGDAEFKTEMPHGVFDIPGAIEYVQSSTAETMSPNRMQFCVGRLETHRLAVSGQTDVEHIENLERRHGSAA